MMRRTKPSIGAEAPSAPIMCPPTSTGETQAAIRRLPVVS